MDSLSESQLKNITVPQHKYYKSCIVPMCYSTTITCPHKLFLNVPKIKKVREIWCLAMRRDRRSPVSVKSTFHICEDHFNLEEDMENYVKFKLMGGIKKLKPNVVPHIFDCQLDVRLPTLSAESTTTSSKDDSSSIQMDQNNTIYSVQVLSDVNESPKQSTIAVMETCVKTEEEDASFYHSNQPALYNLVETEMNGEIDNEIDVKYQPFTISLDQIKEEIDIDDYNSPSVTHQLKKRKSSHQSAYEAIDQSSRTESDTHIHNPVEDIQKDEWYHFGNNIACQLRNLSLERALMCQQKIIEILTQERIDFITKMKTEDTNTTKED